MLSNGGAAVSSGGGIWYCTWFGANRCAGVEFRGGMVYDGIDNSELVGVCQGA